MERKSEREIAKEGDEREKGRNNEVGREKEIEIKRGRFRDYVRYIEKEI